MLLWCIKQKRPGVPGRFALVLKEAISIEEFTIDRVLRILKNYKIHSSR